MKKILTRLAVSLFLIAFSALAWSAGDTTLTWYGHAAFEIVTPKGKVLMIDPWLKNPMNPYAKDGKDPLSVINKPKMLARAWGK